MSMSELLILFIFKWWLVDRENGNYNNQFSITFRLESFLNRTNNNTATQDRSPRIRRANCMSLGKMVTRLA